MADTHWWYRAAAELAGAVWEGGSGRELMATEVSPAPDTGGGGGGGGGGGAAAAPAGPTSSTQQLEVAGVTTAVLVLLAAVWSLSGHALSARSRFLTESGTACLLGLTTGLLLLGLADVTGAWGPAGGGGGGAGGGGGSPAAAAAAAAAHSGATLSRAVLNDLLHFNSAAFFTYLLPPVIFYAGLSVQRRLFFRNLPTILSFGILGTFISFLLNSAALYFLVGTTFGLDAQDCLALGAVFAATDSVAVLQLLDPGRSPQLFSLVFGEGIVNDATSVVLLGALARMAQHGGAGQGSDSDSSPSALGVGLRLLANFIYLLLSSAALGVAAGWGVAALLRSRMASQGPHHEVALIGLLSYLSYLAAEVLGLSGILALFCCGAAVSHFALRDWDKDAALGAPAASAAAAVAAAAAAGGAGGAGSDIPGAGAGGGVQSDGLGVVRQGAPGRSAAEQEQRDGVQRGAEGWLPTPFRSSLTGDEATGAASGRGSAGGADGEGSSGRGVYGNGPTGHDRVRQDEQQDDEERQGLLAGPDHWEGEHRGEHTVLQLPDGSVRCLEQETGGRGGGGRGRGGRGGGGGGGGGCISPGGAVATHAVFHSLSYVAEGLIFIYVGLNCLDPVRWKVAYVLEVVWLVGVLLVLLVATRAAAVVPLSALHNLYAPARQRLSARDVVVVWWSGLMRGAVSVAMVYLNFDVGGGGGAGAGGAGGANLGPRARVGGGTGRRGAGGAAAAAAAAAEAAAKAAEEEARQQAVRDAHHATLIVATLLVVVASVLVVSTLTKTVLQAIMQADQRKSPLRVLGEVLADPWVAAAGRLRSAFRRLGRTPGAGDVDRSGRGGGSSGRLGGGGGGSSGTDDAEGGGNWEKGPGGGGGGGAGGGDGNARGLSVPARVAHSPGGVVGAPGGAVAMTVIGAAGGAGGGGAAVAGGGMGADRGGKQLGADRDRERDRDRDKDRDLEVGSSRSVSYGTVVRRQYSTADSMHGAGSSGMLAAGGGGGGSRVAGGAAAEGGAGGASAERAAQERGGAGAGSAGESGSSTPIATTRSFVNMLAEQLGRKR